MHTGVEFSGGRYQRFALLTEACDRLLADPRAHPSWMATPFLHVISGHPVHLSQYESVLGESTTVRSRDRPVIRTLLHLNNLLRARGEIAVEASGTYDGVLIGALVDVAHLESSGDFYFGNIQRELAARGVRSLLLLRNHTASPVSALQPRAFRAGDAARAILPDSLSAREEWSFVRDVRAGRDAMRELTDETETPFQRAVRDTCASRVATAATTASLRLERQVEAICRSVQPRMVMVTYEGYAWERCAWRGARRANPSVLCAGYQHTIMRENSHAMRRSFGATVDPDILLCMGEFTRDELARERWLANKQVRVLGTHRRECGQQEPAVPVRRTGCLVLPEGIRGEAEFLFRFALEAAECMPDRQFILRSHPILSPERIISRLLGRRKLPANVEIGRGRSLGEDLARCGALLYRGSSTVVYGILAGLKPFYVGRPGELTLDPLFRLGEWRLRIENAADLETGMAEDIACSDEVRQRAWHIARDACRRMAVEEQAQGLDWLARVCKSEAM